MDSKQLEIIFIEQRESFKLFHEECKEIIISVAQVISNCLLNGGKILIFGNGGSAADAQHVAGELVGRFLRERDSYAAIALTTDTSILTAIGNDYGFDFVFRRQLEALAKPEDLAVGISTSGNSLNVLNAIKWGNENKIQTLGFSGKNGGKLLNLCDICFCAPSNVTPRIQEIHLAAWHSICDLVESELILHKQG